MVTLKQMIQRLPIALEKETASKTSENLTNEIRQIIYYSYWTKEVTKKYMKIYNEFDKNIIQNGSYI